MNTGDVAQYEKRLIAEGSPYELQQVDISGISCLAYKHAAQSLNGIFRKASSMGDAPLAIFAERRLSYREVFRASARLSSALLTQFSIRAGTRVAIALENRPEWVIAFVAIISIGATAVLIDERDTQAIADSLMLSESAAAIVGSKSANILAGKLSQTIALIAADSLLDATPSESRIYLLDDLLRFESKETEFHTLPDPSPESDAIIVFTSGTTGRPKGVALTHRGVVTGLLNMVLGGLLASVNPGNASVRNARTRFTPCALVLLPLSYIGGYAQLLLMMNIGGKIVFMNCWDCLEACRLIDGERVRSLVGATPAQVLELIEAKPEPGSLGSLGLHGSALHSTTLQKITTRWPQVVVGSGYGMTETNGTVATIAGQALRRNPACVGRVLPTFQIRIVDSNGADVPEGETGEIWLRGASLMRGYCDKATGLSDGWFKSGDLGILTQDHVLSIVDRAKHLINFNGRSISALALERAIVSEFGVNEAVVLYSDQDDPEKLLIVAVVPGTTLVDTDDICRRLTAYLAGSPMTISVVRIAAPPMNRAGKIDRTALRMELVDGK